MGPTLDVAGWEPAGMETAGTGKAAASGATVGYGAEYDTVEEPHARLKAVV